MSILIEKCTRLKEASYILADASTDSKNKALELVAKSLKKNTAYILSENKKDVEAAKAGGTKESLVDRLRLDEGRMQGIIESIDTIIKLKDPVWSSNEVFWVTIFDIIRDIRRQDQ